jgi:hypothetical protein
MMNSVPRSPRRFFIHRFTQINTDFKLRIYEFDEFTNYNDYEFQLQIYEFDEFTNYSDYILVH